MNTDRGRNDLQDHLTRRTEYTRTHIAPWLDHVRPLRGARLLEIGCGTGSDLVALAEQGAVITAIDICEESTRAARLRCQSYGVPVVIQTANATEIGELFSHEQFDWVVLYACLEHMTHDERLRAISEGWRLLGTDGCLAVIDTPNRLWHTDLHTAEMPFFQWLPDELAFECFRFSPRENMQGRFDETTPEKKLAFLRAGRGVSFHEFALVLGSIEAVKVASYHREFLEMLQWIPPPSPETSVDDRYIEVLRELAPEISPAFFQLSLDFVLRKP